MSDRHPIGSDGCTCRLHFFERPGSPPGNRIVYGADCPHHREPKVRIVSTPDLPGEFVRWQPTDSDS